MNIKEFVSGFKSHPVLFVGTGLSLRYLNNAFNWDELLKSTCKIVDKNEENYLDIKAKHIIDNGVFNFPSIGSDVEKLFNQFLTENRNGALKDINDEYYKSIENGKPISRFKLYVASVLKNLELKSIQKEEIELLKQLKNNISSIITTNYDTLLENIIGFKPLIGNDILLSNPYGALYKIHGCVSDPSKIIISSEDYDRSKSQDELIRAQLLSLFIHNPVIFLGYGAQDENVNNILKTVFKYTEYNTEAFRKIKENFLIVEYAPNSENEEISDYHLKIEDIPIQIKKLQTDKYSSLYKELVEAKYPISAVDIRKVQNIMSDIITAKSSDKKSVREVIVVDSQEEINNEDRVLVITYGNRETANTIKQTVFKEKLIPEHMSVNDFINNYFEIIDEKNKERIKVIDRLTIAKNVYFPILGFQKIYSKLKFSSKIEQIQKDILDKFVKKTPKHFTKHMSIEDVFKDSTIATSNKHSTLVFNVWNDNIPLENLELFLRNYDEDKGDSKYRRLITLYDYKRYK
ncbi:SIR2 family protein [Flavobacterium psychrotrophum]|uniref:SIR2 family protein n=1 Tax=Flavobacterium psychrotrophum TaxID=2294119 RepID=UPI0013C4753F|nr:SIR2 family protein [Flavobacterium psychrotrophum]